MVRLKKYLWLTTAILLALGLASCNINKAPEPTTDANAVYTSVASTMIAQLNDQLTQTAQAVPATALASPTELSTLAPLPTISVESTLAPANTSAIGSIPTLAVLTPVGSASAAVPTTSSSTAVGCADSIFIQDITIPDGTVETPGAVFTKTWRMKNTGTCAWNDGFKFAFAYGTKLGTGPLTITLTTDSVPAGGSKDFGIALTAPSVPNTYTGCWKMQTNQAYWFGQVACVTIKVSK